MKNKFLNISIGVTIMLLGAGFFVRSIQTATAAPSPYEFVEGGTSKIGKYQMSLSKVINTDGNVQTGVIVWDTETGQSKYYAYKFDTKEFYVATGQLPANPLGN